MEMLVLTENGEYVETCHSEAEAAKKIADMFYKDNGLMDNAAKDIATYSKAFAINGQPIDSKKLFNE